MTDEQIKKALERCGQHRECCYCNSVEECGNKRVLTASVLDLINRKDAEIVRLRAEADMAEGYADALVARAKSEAIKEFAERLKEKRDGGKYPYVLVNVIDNLVAEMVGDSDER